MATKKNIFSLYRNLLAGVKQIKFIETDLKQTTPWFIDILAERRDELITYLKSEQIGSRPIYPALHSQPAYNFGGDYPVAKKIAKAGLWLPSSVNLTAKQITIICKKIKYFYESYRTNTGS